MPHPEKILGIQRTRLEAMFGAPLPQGFLEPTIKLSEILAAAELRVRDAVEDDPSFKQIIPYTVLVLQAGPAFKFSDRVFTYSRGKGGAEARLHARRSLGVGGHVEERDLRGSKPMWAYADAVLRELIEEVSYDGSWQIDPRATPMVHGYLNDDSNAVGSVHLGVVHCVKLQSANVASREADALADPEFFVAADLNAARDRFETWSQLVIAKFWG